MFKFAVLNDLHFADNPPLSRQAGYQDQLFDKLAGVGQVMHEQSATCLIITGDVFHLKHPNRVSHALVNRLIDLFRYDFDGIDVLIAPGNHDLTESGIESLPRQPLQSLFTSESALPLIKGEEYCVLGTGETRVLILGRHYDSAGDFDPTYYLCTEAELKDARRYKVTTTFMVAHGSITPPGEHPIYDHITVDDIPWQDADLVPDLLLCGHLHEDYGIHKVQNGPIYVNLGSFGRPSRNQFVDRRDFLIGTVTDTHKIELERFPIPHMLPAAEVFQEPRENYEDEAVGEFAAQLASSIVLEETPLEEALASLGDVPRPVLERIKKYLEEAGI